MVDKPFYLFSQGVVVHRRRRVVVHLAAAAVVVVVVDLAKKIWKNKNKSNY